MRWALRVAVGLGVLLVVLVGALLVVLPRIAGSEAVRARLESEAKRTTGQDVSWKTLSFGLFPPRLVVTDPRVTAPGGNAQPLVEARRVDLRLALLPLLTRTVVIDSLTVEGVTVRLVRTRAGFELPLRSGTKSAASAPPSGAPKSRPSEGRGSSLGLAVKQVRLRDSRLQLEDRTVSPPARIELTDLSASAEGRSLDAPLDVELSGRLSSGGGLRVAGTATLQGRMDLAVKLDGVDLAVAAPYLARGERAAGTLSGMVELKGPVSALEHLTVDLALANGDVSAGQVVLKGPARVRAELSGAPSRLAGRFDVDASQAALAYGKAFFKPPGTSAELSGRLVPQPDGSLAVDELHLRVRNLDAQGKLRTGARTRLELDAAPVDLAGWGALVPPLAKLEPAGRLDIGHLTVATAPLDLRGRLALDGFQVRPPGRDVIRVQGPIEALGDTIRATGLRITTAGQTLHVDAKLTGLDASRPRYQVQASAKDADTNVLLTALAGLGDTLYGPLTATANLSGPLGGSASPLATLGGHVQLKIAGGRLKGVSLLRGVFDRLGAFGEAALLAGTLRGGKTLQHFYEDDFQSLSGTFQLSGATARTNDLRLVYRHYAVDLRGTLGLLDESLDFTGKLTIDPTINAALAQGTPGASEAENGAKVIPLARVQGTLRNPRVDLSRDAVLQFAASFAAARERGKLERKLDKKLGKGAGRDILRGLEGILGGPPPPSEPPKQ